jgi:hypothetical protein
MLLRDLKKNRAGFFAKIQKEVDKIKSGAGSERQVDDRYWQPTKDKVGNAISTIRFLQPLSEEELPWGKFYQHGFKNNTTGLWLIERCPTSIGKKCPVCEANTVLWNTGSEKDKDVVRSRKRNLSYVANVLVVSDPAVPENNGKVFLFRFGFKIFQKIMDAMYPQFEDEKPLMPFDPWEGANFKLKVRKVEGYTNYDKSEFGDPSPISEDDSEIDAVLKQCHSLAEFADPKSYKDYDEIKARLIEVLGEDVPVAAKQEEEEDDLPESFTKPEPVKAKAPVKTKVVEKEVDDEEELKVEPPAKKAVKAPVAVEETDEDVEAYLRNLAADE